MDSASAQKALDPCLRRGDGVSGFESTLIAHEIALFWSARKESSGVRTLVIPAQAGIQ
jgi:hypothetical protein